MTARFNLTFAYDIGHKMLLLTFLNGLVKKKKKLEWFHIYPHE